MILFKGLRRELTFLRNYKPVSFGSAPVTSRRQGRTITSNSHFKCVHNSAHYQFAQKKQYINGKVFLLLFDSHDDVIMKRLCFNPLQIVVPKQIAEFFKITK